MKIKGIYKITSPTGKIYIGQSVNVIGRFATYKRYACPKQPKLLASLKAHGVENHKFEIIHELPNDVCKYTIDQYEQYCIDQYREAGIEMLNIAIQVRTPFKGCRFSKEHREKLSNAKKGKASRGYGFKNSDEAKKKISESLKGKKLSKETIAKREATRKANGNNKQWSDEARKRRSELYKGRKLTESHKAKISASLIGNKRANKKSRVETRLGIPFVLA